ncbi:MAG: hypothetical protein JRN09_01165 [Nitrososphaerota archaeon]|nr:hypothetical protein [Nitrososphaerota archaeon]
MRRPAFAVPPRVALPILLVIVGTMFLLFVSLDSNGVSLAKIAATVVVTAAILVVFAVLALVSRASRGGRRDGAD